MVLIFSFKFVAIIHVNWLINWIIHFLNFFISLVLNQLSSILCLFLHKFNHQSPILCSSFIKQHYCMRINCFIKNNIFYFSSCTAYHIIELVYKQKKKLKFVLLSFYELEIIHEAYWIFYLRFYGFSKYTDIGTIFYHYETVFIEDLCILCIRDNVHWVYSHEVIT